jgi:hypothetical protein
MRAIESKEIRERKSDLQRERERDGERWSYSERGRERE